MGRTGAAESTHARKSRSAAAATRRSWCRPRNVVSRAAVWVVHGLFWPSRYHPPGTRGSTGPLNCELGMTIDYLVSAVHQLARMPFIPACHECNAEPL